MIEDLTHICIVQNRANNCTKKIVMFIAPYKNRHWGVCSFHAKRNATFYNKDDDVIKYVKITGVEL